MGSKHLAYLLLFLTFILFVFVELLGLAVEDSGLVKQTVHVFNS